MYNHNKAQQSKNHVHISWDILFMVSMLTETHTTAVESKTTKPAVESCLDEV